MFQKSITTLAARAEKKNATISTTCTDYITVEIQIIYISEVGKLQLWGGVLRSKNTTDIFFWKYPSFRYDASHHKKIKAQLLMHT